MSGSVKSPTNVNKQRNSFSICDSDGDCLWGDELQTKSGIKNVNDVLKTTGFKRIGLYFSASWVCMVL